MSYFDLSTDGKIPRDGLRKHVQTQIPTEGGALNGLIRFRWTSSQDSWFVPSLSHVMYEFEVQKTGGNVPLWQRTSSPLVRHPSLAQ